MGQAERWLGMEMASSRQVLWYSTVDETCWLGRIGDPNHGEESSMQGFGLFRRLQRAVTGRSSKLVGVLYGGLHLDAADQPFRNLSCVPDCN
jgi:hypothetical protein